MTSAVGIVGSSSGVVSLPSAAVSSATDTASQTSTAATSLQNPKVILDPSAGFITEYLSDHGSQVVSQTPSAATVAYLRQGLTAEGTVKPNPSSASTTA